jgi:hypothetical protein
MVAGDFLDPCFIGIDEEADDDTAEGGSSSSDSRQLRVMEHSSLSST